MEDNCLPICCSYILNGNPKSELPLFSIANIDPVDIQFSQTSTTHLNYHIANAVGIIQ